MLFLPVYGKNKMPDCIGCFIVGVSSNVKMHYVQTGYQPIAKNLK